MADATLAGQMFQVRALASARALGFHRMLMRAGLALGGAFVWIGVYRYFYQLSADTAQAFARTAFLYALSQSVIILLVPFAAARFASGLRRSMLTGASAVAVGFLALGAFGSFGDDLTLALLFVAYALLSGAYAAFYRTPHVGVWAGSRGRVWRALRELVVIAVPVAGGFAIEAGVSLPAVLGVAGGIVALSLIPLTRMSETYERYAPSYKETFSALFAREHRALLLHGVCGGVQGTALLLAWPVVVFLITDRSFALTGLVLSASLVTAAVVRVLLRRYARPPSVPISMTLAGAAWIMRLVAATPVDIMVVDTYAHAGASPREGIDRASFEQRADGGAYFDDYTVLKEEALALGRLLAALGVALFALDASLSFAFVALFVAAAIASALSVSVSLRAGRSMF